MAKPLHKAFGFAHVRALTLRQILEEWRKEAEFNVGVVERELRRAVLNLQMDWRNGELIDPLKPDDELPGLDELVDRDWMIEFCGKGDWPFPKFWFPEFQEDFPPGRPTLRDEAVHEFAERVKAGKTLKTISKEASAISGILRAKGHEKGIQSKTIQNHIRPYYDDWKKRKNL